MVLEKYDDHQITSSEKMKRLNAMPPIALPKERLSKMAKLPITASIEMNARKNHFIRYNRLALS
jgi:hypothetical protein